MNLSRFEGKLVQALNATTQVLGLNDLTIEIILGVDFKAKLNKRDITGELSIIAEIKKASPSAGILRNNFNHIDIAKSYVENGAPFLSVLTEEDFFLGNLIHVSKVKQKINLPILCKDFFIDPFQVHLAKSYGADAILIILAGVTEKMANQLYEGALKLNMSVIVEVHTLSLIHI